MKIARRSQIAILLLPILLSCSRWATAQNNSASSNLNSIAFSYMNDTSLTYNEIVHVLDSLYLLNPLDSVDDDESREYSRWKNFWSTRLDQENGHLPVMGKKLLDWYINSPCNTTSINGVTFEGWKELGPTGLEKQVNGAITSLSVNPQNEKEIYAGAWGGGLWYTNNKGITWTNLLDNTPFSGPGVRGLLVDYTVTPHRIYAGLSNTMKIYEHYGMIYSDNNGASWQNIPFPVGSNLNNSYVSKIMFNATKTKLFVLSSYHLHRFNLTAGLPSAPLTMLDFKAAYPQNSSLLRSMEILPGHSDVMVVSSGYMHNSNPPNEPYAKVLASLNVNALVPSWTDITQVANIQENIIQNGDFNTAPSSTAGKGIWAWNDPSGSAPSGEWDNVNFKAKLNVYNDATNTAYVSGNPGSKLGQTFLLNGYARSMSFDLSFTVTIPAHCRLIVYSGWDLTSGAGLNKFYDSDIDLGWSAPHSSPYTVTVSYSGVNSGANYAKALIFESTQSGFSGAIPTNPQIIIDDVVLIPLANSKILLTTTPSEPDEVYYHTTTALQHHTARLHYNSGTSSFSQFLIFSEPEPAIEINTDFKFAFRRSDEDPNLFLYGGVQLYGSFDDAGELKFINLHNVPTAIANVAKHDDINAIEIVRPIGSNIEYIVIANDGGVSMWERDVAYSISSSTYNPTFLQLNGNINASSLHDIGSSIYTGAVNAGAHDQGLFLYFPQKSGKWEQRDAGDGYTCGFSKTYRNQSHFIGDGSHNRFTSTSANYWASPTPIRSNWSKTYSPGYGLVYHRPIRRGSIDNFNFFSYLIYPMTFHPSVGDYCGGFIRQSTTPYNLNISNVGRITNNTSGGGTQPLMWENLTLPTAVPASVWGGVITPYLFHAPDQEYYSEYKVTAIDVNDNDAMNMWASLSKYIWGTDYVLLHSTDGGLTWTDRTFGVHHTLTESSHIKAIETDPNNANRVWVGLSYYHWDHPGAQRVYTSIDGGLNWDDISIGLPGMPINDLAYDNRTEILFAATDIGVFFYDTKLSTPVWTCLDLNMPHVIVTGLDINYCTGKMYASTFGRGAWECKLPWNWDINNPAKSIAISSLPGTTYWESSRNIDRSVYVKSGETLIIQRIDPNIPVIINMAVGTVINVEENAKLIVDDATITNECGTLWGGIAVHGNDLLDQNDMSNQGYVELRNHATIENAQTGIGTGVFWFSGGEYYPNIACCGGGIIKADDAIFRNNRKSVSFMKYGFDNISYFKHCDFIADAYLAEGHYLDANGNKMGQPEFVTAWDVIDVLFENNTFSQVGSSTYPAIGNFGQAFGTFDASLKINYNTFNNLFSGIHMENGISPLVKNAHVPTITHNTMNNMHSGIYVSNTNYKHPIHNNTINLNFIPYQLGNTYNYAFGIYYDHCQGFDIQDNTINYTPSLGIDYPDVDLTWGILIHNSSATLPAFSSKVRRNNINDIKYGITALASNLTTQITCNTFTNPNIAITKKAVNIRVASTVNIGGSLNFGLLQQIQGVGCATNKEPAGNAFSLCATPSLLLNRFQVDEKPPGGYMIKYIHHTNQPYPLDNCYFTTHGVSPDGCPSTFCIDHTDCCPVEVPNITDCEQNPEQCQQSIEMLQLERFDKEQLLSDGEAQYLFDLIQNPSYSAAYTLNELLAVGNILSDSLLKAVIDRPFNALSDYQLKNLMIANSRLQPEVYDFLAQKRPVVAYNYAVWYLQQLPELSDREELELGIQEIKRLEDDKIQALVYAYDVTNKHDSAALLLRTKGYIESAIAHFLTANDFVSAHATIQQLADSGLRALYTHVVNRLQSNGSLLPASSSDSSLYAGLANNSSKVGILASGLLNHTKHISYSPLFPEEVEITSNKTEAFIPIQFTEILPDASYVVFPNPSDGQFSLLSEGDAFGNGWKLELYDMLGRLCFQQPLPAGKLRAEFGANQLQAGNYILRLKNEDSEIFRTKLNIYPR